MAKKPTVSDTTNEEARRIGARVGRARDQKGLTNKEIAAKVGLTENGVKKIMTGESATQYAKLKRLAEILDVTPNELLGVSGEPGDLDEVFAGVQASYQSMAGMDEAEAEQLALLVREVVEAPLTPSARKNPILARRIQVETAIRQSFAAKPRKGPDA